MSLGIFFNANKEPVFLCLAIITTPNLPSPKVLPIAKSYIESLDTFFFWSTTSINLLGGDLESELSVEVGDPSFLKRSS